MFRSKSPICFLLASIFMLFAVSASTSAEEYKLFSPDKKIELKVFVTDLIQYSATLNSKQIITVSTLAISIQDYADLGINPEIINIARRSVNKTLHPKIKVKSAVITDHFNELTLQFKNSIAVVFRVYDDGIAYRFITSFPDRIKVKTETIELSFPKDTKAYFYPEKSFLTHSEELYEYSPLAAIPADKMSSLPLLLELDQDTKVVFTEAGLEDYPGLYVQGTDSNAIKGLFPAVALEEKQTRDRTVEVSRRADYIAVTAGTRLFPWRTLIIAEQDRELIQNQMVYKLSGECRLKDTSWIRPGKVAWDWWNANNIFGVDFNSGINTKTYQYYIDFAAKYGIEYIILDEGWSDPSDLFKINPDIDMVELFSYAREKHVGIILWVVWKALDDKLQAALQQFQEWGAKGIKVDFMQRDDQWMVNYYWRIAAAAAEHHMLVDFHGSYKPAGLRRAYPNVLTREGVKGLENTKWSKQPDPEHNVTLPFIRMLAGPMDYTPGAMINAQKKNFFPVFYRPMSLGTRCHQLAMYVVFESPLQMLADSPSHYLQEKECLEFLSRVPVVWDQTIVLEAKVADYIVLARKNGNDWYLGAMTDWNPREFTLDLSFIGPGQYDIEFYCDGPNAAKYGNDYVKKNIPVISSSSLQIKLAPGGGWAARIYKTPADK